MENYEKVLHNGWNVWVGNYYGDREVLPVFFFSLTLASYLTYTKSRKIGDNGWVAFYRRRRDERSGTQHLLFC